MKSALMIQPVGPWLLQVVGVAAVYYAAARLGLVLQIPGTNSSPVWPPSGIGLAALMLMGYRVWPGVAIGAFLANLITLPYSLNGFLASSGICLGNTVEHVVGLLLLRRFIGLQSPFDQARDVFRFVAVAGVASAVAASNGTLVLWSSGIIPSEVWGKVWFTWWLGDTAGMLILTPMLFCCWREPRGNWSGLRLVELFVGAAMSTLVAESLFGGWFGTTGEISAVIRSLPYLVVPGLLWAAFRFGQRETSVVAVLISAISIWHTWQMMQFRQGAGPFVSSLIEPNTSLLMLQIFVCAVAITATSLAAAVSERNRSEAGLVELTGTLEHRVADRTAELAKANTDLARSNQELDDFAYIASHDLKEPLRGISNYSNFLVEDYGDKLGEDGHAKLATVQRLTVRMENLIDSLLTYSRVGRVDLAFGETNLTQVVEDVLDSLQLRLQELNVEVRIPQTLPTVPCDRVRVAEVFRNLITNAMKYNDKVEKWIEISYRSAQAGDVDGGTSVPAVKTSSHLIFTVRDNGIGIREKHLESVFRIFKRLNGRDEFGGGTGVGLTIIKKIIERHGGRIWVESVFGEGTTFCFTLQQG